MSKAEEFARGWLRHRKVLLDLLELIENRHVHFKPWENAFSLGALAVHIATSMDMFVQAVKTGRFALPSNVSFETMDDVRGIVKEYTEKTTSNLQTLLDSQLEETLEFNGFYATGKTWLENARDHEVHHKGQLFTYARMVGIEKLPFFIVQPPKRG